uniref:Neurotransmitter-gated ion-channel ligand-binding domain-containing protein n=1 Tax=Romanomermis culicivorax TaxID=13658 RepID=A0A915J4V5_ROMCU
MERMSSISPQCNEMKHQYDDCFHEWFTDKFLTGQAKSDDDPCEKLLQVYKDCVHKALKEHKINMESVEKDVLNTDLDKSMSHPQGKERKERCLNRQPLFGRDWRMNSDQSKATQLKKRPTTTNIWKKLVRKVIEGRKKSELDSQFPIESRTFKVLDDQRVSNQKASRQMDCEIKNSTFKDALLSTAILNDMGPNFDNEVEVQRQLCQHRNEYKQQLRGQQKSCNIIQKSPTKKIVEILRSGSYSLDKANDAFNRAVLSKLVKSKKKSIDAVFEGSLHRKCKVPLKNIEINLDRVVWNQLAPDSHDSTGATFKQTSFEKHIGLILPAKENIDHNSSSRVLSELAAANSIVGEESIKVKTEKATPEKRKNRTDSNYEKILSELAATNSKVETSADPAEKEFICSKGIHRGSSEKILSELAAASSSVNELYGKQKNLFKKPTNMKLRREAAAEKSNRSNINGEKILSELAAAGSNIDTRSDVLGIGKIRFEDRHSNGEILNKLAAASCSFGESYVKQKNRFEVTPSTFVKLRKACHIEEKKSLFYQCLPYITGFNKGSDIFFPQLNALLILEPPPQTNEPNDRTSINVDQVIMPTFHVLGNSDFRPDIELELNVSWQDSRLKWDPDVWKIRRFPADIKPLLNVWGPRFSSQSTSHLNYYFDVMTYYDAQLNFDGYINATLGGQLVFTDCRMDVETYPHDDINCCMDFAVSPRDNKAQLSEEQTDASKFSWDDNEGGVWKVGKMEFTRKTILKGAEMINGAQMCVTALRNTAVLGLELSLPMGVSAIVMMCAQFAGKWQMQIYVKMFALFLQIFCFQTLVPNEALNVATRVPRIYIFYHFTIAVTLFSLVQTMIFWALSRRWFKMPPPHRLTSFIHSMGRYLLGDSAVTSKVKGGGAPPTTETANNVVESGNSRSDGYRSEWEIVFATMHAILSIVIILAYLIGVWIIF